MPLDCRQGCVGRLCNGVVKLLFVVFGSIIGTYDNFIESPVHFGF